MKLRVMLLQPVSLAGRAASRTYGGRAPRFAVKNCYRTFATSSVADPLRVVLFGTDNFSLYSLKKLYDMKQDPDNRLQLLHIVTRQPKPEARNMQLIEASVVEKFARAFAIPVYYCESNAQLESLCRFNYDLAIAVSYGKKIPEVFLDRVKYGGINIHPSMLPQLRGPAPLHWALLNGLPVTGVTCQTLDPHAFDRGKLLARSEEISIGKHETLASLHDRLGEAGADLLVNVLNSRIYEDPNYELQESNKYPESYAPPIESRHRVVNLQEDTIASLEVKYNALGSIDLFHDGILTTKQQLTKKQKRKKKNSLEYRELLEKTMPPIKEAKPIRVKIRNPRNATEIFPDIADRFPDFEPGQYEFLMPLGSRSHEDLQIVIKVKDGFIVCDDLLVEKFVISSPFQFQASMHKRGLDPGKRFRAIPPDEALLSQKKRRVLSQQPNEEQNITQNEKEI
jgi:methionyl-tRNA formyltransferase